MKKKIYDEPVWLYVQFILDHLAGSELVDSRLGCSDSKPGQKFQKKLYHVGPEGVTLEYKYFHLPSDQPQEQIWLYGTTKAVGRLEHRIMAEIGHYCAAPDQYITRMEEKNRISIS